MIILFDSLSEFRAFNFECMENANLVLLRNHEEKDFSILKTRHQLTSNDVMKCLIAIDLFNDIMKQDDAISISDIAKKLLEL